MNPLSVFYVTEDDWFHVNQDRSYWTDFRDTKPAKWKKHSEKCEEIDQALKELFFQQDSEVHVIDALSYFSHRGFECHPSILTESVMMSIQSILKKKYCSFYITASIWPSKNENAGIIGFYGNHIVAMDSLSNYFPYLPEANKRPRSWRKCITRRATQIRPRWWVTR